MSSNVFNVTESGPKAQSVSTAPKIKHKNENALKRSLETHSARMLHAHYTHRTPSPSQSPKVKFELFRRAEKCSCRHKEPFARGLAALRDTGSQRV
ncbi:jg2275 [Pararge aegeria aegeria]|uniref:Jg2275 protein n=1 Tax=Pararge aegeria aegeria TaxID=348720 RepID=A0A8S4RWG0_9NEOP|nr:jg2275 [Pararge aegeria aegeria]